MRVDEQGSAKQSFSLRPYQKEAIAALVQFYEQPHGLSGLCVLPTASGKTVIFAHAIAALLAQRPALRVLVLAHTREIVQQNARTIAQTIIAHTIANTLASTISTDGVSPPDCAPHSPAVEVGVYCKSLQLTEVRQVTCASRDSMVTLVQDDPLWDLVLVDEAHLISPADTSRYQQILAQIFLHQGQYKLWGFTATPFRMNHGFIYDAQCDPVARQQMRASRYHSVFKMDRQRPLFEQLIFQRRLYQLVQIGYLCPVRAIGVDRRGVANTQLVKRTRQDFELADLHKVSDSSELVQHIVADWLLKTGGRLASVFYAASVEQGNLFSHCLAELGITAPLIEARTEPEDRQQWLAQFANAEINVLVNINTLTTGWDCPRLACIVMARPTLSAGLFMQIVGRGLRWHSSKIETLLLDYGENIARFGMLERLKPLLDTHAVKQSAPGMVHKICECPCCDTLCSIYDRECQHCGEQLKDEGDLFICPCCNAGNADRAQWCEVCGEQYDGS